MSLFGKAGKAVQAAKTAQTTANAAVGGTLASTVTLNAGYDSLASADLSRIYQQAAQLAGVSNISNSIVTPQRTTGEWVDYLKKYEDLPEFQEALKLMNSKLYKELK